MVSQGIINISEKVSEECGRDWLWQYHILPVARHSILLAKELKADIEIAQLNALLHDYGRLHPVKTPDGGEEEHAKTSADLARKILPGYGYSSAVVETVCTDILSHSGSSSGALSLTSQILRTADGMAHFDAIPFLFATYHYPEKKAPRSTISAAEKMAKKIQESWDLKMSLPLGHKLCDDVYSSAKTAFAPPINSEYLSTLKFMADTLVRTEHNYFFALGRMLDKINADSRYSTDIGRYAALQNLVQRTLSCKMDCDWV